MTDPELPASDDPLTPKQREAWNLHALGWGTKRIAFMLGISRAAVRERLTAAAKNLDRDQEDEVA